MTSTGSTPPLIRAILTNLRHLAERFSRGVTLRRHLSKQFQSLPLYLPPEAALRYWRWGVERADRMLFRMVRELVSPGSVVWDVSFPQAQGWKKITLRYTNYVRMSE